MATRGAHSAKANRKGEKTRWRHRPLIPVSDEDEGEWESICERVRRMIRLAPFKGKGAPPYSVSENVLKREVYRVTRRYMKEKKGHIIENIAINENVAPKHIKFRDNPFYWVLILMNVLNWQKDRGQISKISRTLLYADKHNIDPDLVVGFLHQCGTPTAICRKANAGEFEQWYQDRRAEMVDW